MCGIAAWSGKNPKKLNLYKLGVLGIFNEKRGTHSCGISRDFKIQVGVDDYKVFRDFMGTDLFKAPEKYPFMLAHTRYATGGKHDIYNAHPFGFGYNKEEDCYKFVGVHNGSLINDNKLAEEYGIQTKVLNKENKQREKIDSEILLEIIYKSKNFKVLEKYDGAAALVFANQDEPNVIYCYKGASSIYNNTKNVQDERPLFYYKETKNSLYISSIKASLEAIAEGDYEDKIGEFESNYVYKITDGDVDKAVRFKINRKERYQKYSASNHSYYNRSPYSRDYFDAFSCADKINTKKTKSETKVKSLPPHQGNINPSVKFNIYNDKLIDHPYNNPIQFNKMRYVRNGHNISGIYTYIDKYGFYFLGMEITGAIKEINKLVGKKVTDKDFLFNTGYTAPDKNYIPFKSEDYKKFGPYHYFFYFVNGIRFANKTDYDFLKKDEVKFNSLRLSMAAVHPVIEDVPMKSFIKQQIFYKGTLATGTFSPLESNKVYTIEDGNCVKIEHLETSNNNDSKIDDSKNKEEIIKVDDSEEILKKVSQDLIKNEAELSSKYAEDANKVQEILFDTLFNVYHDITSMQKKLVRYEDTNPIAKESLDIVDDFTKGIESIMVNKLKIELN